MTAGVSGVAAAGGRIVVTVAGVGGCSCSSSSTTSVKAIAAAASASATNETTIGSFQPGGGSTRVRAARPHSRHHS